MCQLREPHNTDLHRYSILNELLSSNQCLYYKASEQRLLLVSLGLFVAAARLVKRVTLRSLLAWPDILVLICKALLLPIPVCMQRAAAAAGRWQVHSIAPCCGLVLMAPSMCVLSLAGADRPP